MNENFVSVRIAPVTRCEKCGRFVRRGLWNWITHVQDQCPYKAPPITREGFFRSEPWHFPPMGPKCREALEAALESYFDEHYNLIKP